MMRDEADNGQLLMQFSGLRAFAAALGYSLKFYGGGLRLRHQLRN
jgi:hypothetical protein